MGCSRCGSKANKLPNQIPAAIKKAQENPHPARVLTSHITTTSEEVEGRSDLLRVADPSPGLNIELLIQAHDLPGPGGANHEYTITRKHPNTPGNHVTYLNFQKGGIQDVGVNGISNEALLAVVLDRLMAFVRGPMSDGYTIEAMQHVANALDDLHARTFDRQNRSVEGTDKK